MKPYKILDLIQGSDEWKQHRLNYITASNVASVLGLSEYKTRQQYYHELLTGKEEQVSDSKQTLFEIGHKAELAGREWVESIYRMEFPAMVCLSNRCTILMASLDGFNIENNMIFECKYVGANAVKDVLKGIVKPTHIAQVQAQLLVTGADKCIYFALDPTGEAAVHEILPDYSYQEKIAKECYTFINMVKQLVEPQPSAKDVLTTNDTLLAELFTVKQQIDALNLHLESLKTEICAKYPDYQKIEGHGIRINRLKSSIQIKLTGE